MEKPSKRLKRLQTKISICKFCGTKSRPRREWQEYCSDTCRWRAWSQQHPRTKTEAKPKDVIPCYYCGMAGNTVDHVPPITLRERLVELNLADRYEFVEVHACKECNNALGALALYTLYDRKLYMKRWIKRRYSRYFKMPEWSDTELAQLGKNLQTSVLSTMLASEITKARIKW